MVARKRTHRVSTGGKAPRRPQNVVAAELHFSSKLRSLGQDSWHELAAVTKNLGLRSTAEDEVLARLNKAAKEKILEILKTDNQKGHDGEFSLLSIEEMREAIDSANCEKEEQQTSSAPAKTREHHNTANTTMQPVDNTSRYSTRSKVKQGRCHSYQLRNQPQRSVQKIRKGRK